MLLVEPCCSGTAARGATRHFVSATHESAGSLLLGAGGEIVSVHDGLATRLVGMPVAGRCDQDGLASTEPGGATVRLHEGEAHGNRGSCAAGGTALGRARSWSDRARTWPVQLRSGLQEPLQPEQRRYRAITTDDDAVFEGKVRRFIAAVLADNRIGAAAFVAFPLRVNGAAGLRMINARAALFANWNRIFTPAVREAMNRAIPHQMFVRDEGAMIGNGVVWFRGAGAIAVNAGAVATP